MVPAGSPPLEGEYPVGGRGLLHHKMDPSVLRTAPLEKGSSWMGEEEWSFWEGGQLDGELIHSSFSGRT